MLTPTIRTNKLSALWWPAIALVALRIMRSWNQTGQKYAGEPDIVKMFLLPEPGTLWLLLSATYVLISFKILPLLGNLPYAVSTGLTSLLISTALSFKLAFTVADAPELVVGAARVLHSMFQGQSLLFRARLVFGLLSLSGTYATYRSLTGGPQAALSSGMSNCSRPQISKTHQRIEENRETRLTNIQHTSSIISTRSSQ